jgi:hypothetical protein
MGQTFMGNNVVWGDIVTLSHGRHKGKKLIVSSIHSSGIWLREPDKDFALALGPYKAEDVILQTRIKAGG